jgi:hypothetical protein
LKGQGRSSRRTVERPEVRGIPGLLLGRQPPHQHHYDDFPAVTAQGPRPAWLHQQLGFVDRVEAVRGVE